MNIYCIAIGGTGTAPLACLMQEQGHSVRGSDTPLYPPMSELLAAAGIEPLVGFDPAHLDPRPDLVVVGNAVPRSNPEAEAVERAGIPRLSMPEALGRFFLTGRSPLVVAGTHGKTTTTSLVAWVYEAAGTQPGYLVGGLPRNMPRSFARGRGPRFIVEGDEYNAAYFDRGPKFLHYRPETLILTSVEHDHADLYPDPASLEAAYARLIELLPPSGLLVACGDSPAVRRLAAAAPCPVTFYGLADSNQMRPEGPVEQTPEGSRFAVAGEDGPIELFLPLAGLHNVANALAVWAAARADALPVSSIADAFTRFAGVRRRMEEVGSAGGVTVVDDFAHHPTAVGATIAALAERYPGRRLVVAFEPRSLTAGRRHLEAAYLAAFAGADRVHLAPVYHAARFAPAEILDLPALAAGLAGSGVEATAHTATEELARSLREEARPGDVVVTMSSGSFGNLPRRLLAELA